MWEWVRRRWIVVTGCSVLSGLAVGMIEDVRNATVGAVWRTAFPPAEARVACQERHFAVTERPDDAVYLVLVTALRGDDDYRHLDQISRTLTRLYGEDISSVIQVEAIACPPLLTSGGNAAQALLDAKTRGLDLLRRANADVVIWGDVLKAGGQIELRFLAREGEGRGDFAAAGTVLDAMFSDAVGTLIAAKAATYAELTDEEAGGYVVDRMQLVLTITTPLIDAMRNSLPSADRATVWQAHARANYWIGLQTGSAPALERAVDSYQQALSDLDRGADPLNWAATQNSLGAALQTIGERERGSARLDQAVAAYKEALKERTPDRVPLDWAETQNSLGNALLILGQREPGVARLEQAVAAYQAVLTAWTQDRVPLDWAATQNNLGNALKTLGERETGTARLEQAVMAFTAALTEFTREKVPLDWAITQNNLGNVLKTLGERTGDVVVLEQAVTAYKAALTERTQDRVPLDWAMTQNNLGATLQSIGAREPGTARLEQAVAAFQAALTERTRDRVPLHWAMTQNNLGSALQLLGERDSGTALLAQAVAAYQAALTERTLDRVPLDHASTRFNLSLVEVKFFAKTADPAHLDRARDHARAALDVYIRAGASQHVAMVEHQLAGIAALHP